MRWRSAQQRTQCTMSPLSVRVSSSCASRSRSSGQYAPDALENSPGSHAAQALAPATQAQTHSGARCRWCKSPSGSEDDGWNSQSKMGDPCTAWHSLTCVGRIGSQSAHAAHCRSCSKSRISSWIWDGRWSRPSRRQCLEASTFLLSKLSWPASNTGTRACQDSTQEAPHNQGASGVAATSMLQVGLGAPRLLSQ